MQDSEREERRESFRVEMTARVAVNPEPGTEVDATDCFPELHAMALLSQTSLIDQEIGLYSERIKDLAVKRTVELINQKMTLIARLIDLQTTVQSDLETQHINIGEGGCGLQGESELEIGQRVALAIVFTPQYYALFCFAEVKALEKRDDHFIYHLHFLGLTETQQQELLKHLFQAQTAARKREGAEHSGSH